MIRSTGKRKAHFKNVIPTDPAVKPFAEWFPANQSFYANFRAWLKDASYGYSALNTYGVAARMALGYLDKPYWRIDAEVDLERMRRHMEQRYSSASTCHEYDKGLKKLAEYLRLRNNRPAPIPEINWDYYIASLPAWMSEQLRQYFAMRSRTWTPQQQHRSLLNILGRTTRCLRWMAAHANLANAGDLTPEIWFDYLETRLEAGIKPVSINHELSLLQAFLLFMEESGLPICQRMLRLEMLEEENLVPRDVPPEQLQRLFKEVQAAAASQHSGVRRTGLMDHAWLLLMLHSGLRTCEVRRLNMSDIDWERRKIRIEQSKGLKDRFVYLSQAIIDALQAYLEVRGPAGMLTDQVFIYRHQPLSNRYCQVRLRTYGRRCGVKITPHQLRHSCATLLLNAGAPVLTVQAILGHKHVDTTLGYARLYDGTVASDYYRAMAQVENKLALEDDAEIASLTPDALLALLDSLDDSLPEEDKARAIQALRAGILALAG
jgi:integrase/recombinase XerD